MRVAGELVDVTALQQAYDVAEDVVLKTIAAHGFLLRALDNEPCVGVEAEACTRMGFPPRHVPDCQLSSTRRPAFHRADSEPTDDLLLGVEFEMGHGDGDSAAADEWAPFTN